MSRSRLSDASLAAGFAAREEVEEGEEGRGGAVGKRAEAMEDGVEERGVDRGAAEAGRAGSFSRMKSAWAKGDRRGVEGRFEGDEEVL